MINIMAQQFVFIWYDMAYLHAIAQTLYFYGMIWHGLMIIIIVQNFAFIQYDMAYFNDYYNETNFCVYMV